MPTILIAGASGYVGGRLLRVLEDLGHSLRCLARHSQYRPSKTALEKVMEGVETAYYLVSAGATTVDAEEERQAAAAFGEAAHQAGVRRIIYLGGLGSNHREIGKLLGQSGTPVIEFRTFIIIGSGSLCFELLRGLVEKSPVMLVPRWVSNRCQPIAIEDVIAYLVEALHLETGGVFEIGGAEQVSYGGLIQEYAKARGLRRFLIPLPITAARLSSWFVGILTPVYAGAARRVIESLGRDRIVNDRRARQTFAVQPRGVGEAIHRALCNEDRRFAETRWCDALPPSRTWGVSLGTRLVQSQTLHVPCSPEAAFAPIRRIGGDTGWYYANWLWRLRGLLDVLAGGVGLRRGRRDPEWVRPGDALDFWRVEACDPPHLLRLSAEMKLPGRAWLQFEVDGDGARSTICLTGIFDPAGVCGEV